MSVSMRYGGCRFLVVGFTANGEEQVWVRFVFGKWWWCAECSECVHVLFCIDEPRHSSLFYEREVACEQMGFIDSFMLFLVRGCVVRE